MHLSAQTCFWKADAAVKNDFSVWLRDRCSVVVPNNETQESLASPSKIEVLLDDQKLILIHPRL